jgi:hypothetical protein
MIRDDPGQGRHGSHNCKSCGFDGGPWELVAKVKGIGLDEAAEFVRTLASRVVDTGELPKVKIAVRRRSHYNLPPGVKFPERIGDLHSVGRDYLNHRGIPDWQIMRWGLGFATIGPLAWRVVMPVYTKGRLMTYAARAVFKDTRRYDMPDRESGANADGALWGEPRFSSELGAVTVAEGIFSAMHLERVGAPNPCALLGSELTEHKIAMLAQFPVILVGTDPDAAGEKAARQIRCALRRTSYVERIELGASPDDCDSTELRRSVAIATGGFERVALSRCAGRFTSLHGA